MLWGGGGWQGSAVAWCFHLAPRPRTIFVFHAQAEPWHPSQVERSGDVGIDVLILALKLSFHPIDSFYPLGETLAGKTDKGTVVLRREDVVVLPLETKAKTRVRVTQPSRRLAACRISSLRSPLLTINS